MDCVFQKSLRYQLTTRKTELLSRHINDGTPAPEESGEVSPAGNAFGALRPVN